MLTSFEIDDNFKRFNWDSEENCRLRDYANYRDLYRCNFARPFRSVLQKIRKRYPLQNTTAQTLIEVNLFRSLTDFYKNLIANNNLFINVDESIQSEWDKISLDNNFIAVLKEICIDNSRFGNALFKVAFVDNEVKFFSVCPDCWFPVFKNGNLNEIDGHILMYDLKKNGKDFKHIEKIHKGYIENEVWEVSNEHLSRKIEDISEFGLVEIDDFSDKWNDFILFPVKNSTESDCYFGESDYKVIVSIVEEIMLTISQNSKIINRHANPKLAGSIENTEINPLTGQRSVPNSDFILTGKDGTKPEYITADLQADAIKAHIDTLMQFFYILTKTPPQAYGIDLGGNLSGESLQKIFMAAIAKVEDIRAVSLTNAVKKTVQCALAFAGINNAEVKIDWGEAIKLDYSEIVKVCNDRVFAGTQSKLSAIMALDNISKSDAEDELKQIISEKGADADIL